MKKIFFKFILIPLLVFIISMLVVAWSAATCHDWGCLATVAYFLLGIIFTFAAIVGTIVGRAKGIWWGIGAFIATCFAIILLFIIFSRGGAFSTIAA